MSNRPLAYVLSERKANLGKMAGKIVIQARPTGRKRVDHRSFCDEVALRLHSQVQRWKPFCASLPKLQSGTLRMAISWTSATSAH